MPLGDNCSTGCLTKNHASYGECLAAKSFKIGYCKSHLGHDRTRQRKWDSDLAAYRQARSEGMQPRSTQRSDVEAAKVISDTTGKAFQAAS